LLPQAWMRYDWYSVNMVAERLVAVRIRRRYRFDEPTFMNLFEIGLCQTRFLTGH